MADERLNTFYAISEFWSSVGLEIRFAEVDGLRVHSVRGSEKESLISMSWRGGAHWLKQMPH